MLPAAIFTFSDQKFLIWPIVGIATGLYGFFQGFQLLRRKRLILNTPASKIRSAAMGLVEVSGVATGPYVISSPLKRLECYYYRSMAWELRQRGKNSEWVKIADESMHLPFYVDDSTDKVLVDPSGADMDLHCDYHEEFHSSAFFESTEMPEPVSTFLARQGINSNGKIKVEEYCIKPENFVFVLGTLSQNPGLDVSITPAWALRAGDAMAKPENGNSRTAQEIIRLSASTPLMPATEMTQQQKIAAALAKAGVSTTGLLTARDSGIKSLSVSATQTATAVAEKSVAADAGGFDLHPPVVLMKGSNDPAFFISWRSQREIVKSLGWKSSMMIWGGPALVLACVYFLIAHLR